MPADDEIMVTPNISRAISRQEQRRNDSILWHKFLRVGPSKFDVDAPRGPPELFQVVVPR